MNSYKVLKQAIMVTILASLPMSVMAQVGSTPDVGARTNYMLDYESGEMNTDSFTGGSSGTGTHEVTCANIRNEDSVIRGIVMAPTNVVPYLKKIGVSCRDMTPFGQIDTSSYSYMENFISDGVGENENSSLDPDYLPVGVLIRAFPTAAHGVSEDRYYISAMNIIGLKADEIVKKQEYDWNTDKRYLQGGSALYDRDKYEYAYTADRDQMRVDGVKVSQWVGYTTNPAQALIDQEFVLKCDAGSVLVGLEVKHGEATIFDGDYISKAKITCVPLAVQTQGAGTNR